MNSSVKFLLLLTIVMWQYQHGAALRCYVCNHATDVMCLMPELIECSQYTVQPPMLWLRYTSDAPTNITQMRQNTTRDGFKCILYNDGLRVSRYCMYSDVCFCQHHGSGHCLECSENGCNGEEGDYKYPMGYFHAIISMIFFLVGTMIFVLF